MGKSGKSVADWAQERPDVVALCGAFGTVTWLQLDRLVSDAVRLLTEQDVQANDVVVCVSKNHLNLLLLYLAALRLGAIPALLPPQPWAALDKKLKVLACRTLWFGEGCNDIPVQAVKPSTVRQLNFSINVNEMEDGITAHIRPTTAELPADRVASILFTSGSTGDPKAVTHMIRQHQASAQGLLSRFHFSHQDTWLLSLPMYHVSGLAIVWRWLWRGGKLKIGQGDLMTDLQDVTHASLVPTQLQRILATGDPLSLTHVLLGGSHIPVELAMQANQRGIQTWLGYGMTEASSTITAKPVDGKTGVGTVLPHREIKIEQQRIYLRGETLASGYYHHGKLEPMTQDTWFDSKDLGVWQGDDLFFLGRADNQFISGGENIHCEEIEAVLKQHSDVEEAFVLPVSDLTFGARPVAVIRYRRRVADKELETLLAQQLEKYKWPVAYFSLPNSLADSGQIKIARKQVQSWFSENQNTYQLVIS